MAGGTHLERRPPSSARTRSHCGRTRRGYRRTCGCSSRPSRRSPGTSRRPARTPTRASAELESLGEEVGRGVAVGSQAAAVEALAGDWAAGGATAPVRPRVGARAPVAADVGGLLPGAAGRGGARTRRRRRRSGARRRGARRRRRRRRDRDLVAARRGARVRGQRAAARGASSRPRRRCGWPTERTTCSRRAARVSTSPRRSSTPVARPRRPSLVEEALARLDRKGATLPAANARARFADLLERQGEGGAAIAAPRGLGS